MAIYYRFSYENDFQYDNKQIPLSGITSSLSLNEVKSAISKNHNLKFGTQYDLLVTDSNGKEYTSETAQIPKGTFLIVQRVFTGLRNDKIMVNLQDQGPNQSGGSLLDDSQELAQEEKPQEEYIDPIPFPSCLICSVCQGVFRDPVIIRCDAIHKCGVSVCERCLPTSSVNGSVGHPCPGCRNTSRIVAVMPNRVLRGVLQSMQLNYYMMPKRE